MAFYEPLVRVDSEGRISGVQSPNSDVLQARLASMHSQIASASLTDIQTHTAGTAGAPDVTRIGQLTDTEVADGYGFNLTAGVTYTFAVRGAGADPLEDAYVLLRDLSTGAFLVEDDDGGAGRSAMLTFTPDHSGTYAIYASSWYQLYTTQPDPGTDYRLDVWIQNAANDVSNTIAGATAIGEGTTYGYIDTASDADVYELHLEAGQVYSFTYAGGVAGSGDFDGEPGENIGILELLDAQGNVITDALNYETALSYFADSDQTVYLRASSYYGTGGYTLDVQGVNPADYNPLDAIDWRNADNIPTQVVDGVETAYVYFAPAGVNYGETADDGVTPMTTYGWEQFQIDGVMSALGQYTPITGIKYVQTTDESLATFRLLTTTSEQYGAYAYPQDPAYGTQAGILVFNLDSGGFTLPASLQQGGFSYEVILHEFGHAHGLAHPHDTGGGSDVMLGVNTYSDLGVYDLNQGVYTVMSYNDGWQTNPDGAQPFKLATVGFGWDGTLSAFDIAKLQERYGVHDYNTGNTTYNLPDTEAAGTYFQAIWDTGGTDTIAYSGTKDAHIDLLAATLDYTPTGGGVVSWATGVHGGYTIANGVVIENATGGSGNDVLLGNSANNTLTGNAGNDTLMGREGNDLLVGGAGNDTLNGGIGVDTASYATATAGVTVNLVAGTATGGAGSDTISLVENVIGSAHQDRIIGDGNVNKVSGGNGIDVVTLGGANDVFVAEQGTKVSTKTGSWSWDVITDFDQAGDDIIDLSGLGSFHFIGTSANKNAFDLSYKMYDSVNGAEKALGIDIDGQPGATQSGPVTIVYGNKDGGSPDFAIILLNTSSVDASDFILGPTSSLSASSAVQQHSDYMFL